MGEWMRHLPFMVAGLLRTAVRALVGLPGQAVAGAEACAVAVSRTKAVESTPTSMKLLAQVLPLVCQRKEAIPEQDIRLSEKVNDMNPWQANFLENCPVNGTATVGVLVVLPLSLKLVRTAQSVKDLGSQETSPKRLTTLKLIERTSAPLNSTLVRAVWESGRRR